MIFASPVWLWALLLVPVVPWLAVWAGRRDQERVSRLVSRALWGRVLVRPWPRWRYVRIALLTAASAAMVLALARPQWGIVREKVEREGVDVVLALDTSGSMATDDVAPSRFFLARAAVEALVSRLDGDRIGLLAFEGEAYPLVPLTLDADAVGLFLSTLEPGIVPAPGTAVGSGLTKGLDMFVDKDRHNKVMVLISDGEDLEGDVDGAIAQAKKAGVVVHTVGVGTERGAPVPQLDKDGKTIGFKKDASGAVVVSHMNPQTLSAIARGTGGTFFRITPQDTSLSALAAAIEGLEQKSLSREYAYRKKERFQIPLGAALVCLAVALGLPLPSRRRKVRASPVVRKVVAAALALGLASVARAENVKDEVLLRPRRLTATGQRQYDEGNHPDALKSFEGAAGLRPDDPRARFNLGDALYKNGKFDQAEQIFRALGQDVRSPLAPAARYNLGNALYEKKDYPGAIQAYRDSLRLTANDSDTQRNLEMALRALQQQEQQKQRQQQQQQKQQQNQPQNPGAQPSPRPQPQGDKPEKRPQTEQEKEQQRFQDETGMPRERAMQLLDALQQNEKEQQKKQLAEKHAEKKGGKDW
jgi:Ca-activated chloride channel family protein